MWVIKTIEIYSIWMTEKPLGFDHALGSEEAYFYGVFFRYESAVLL